MIGSTAGPVSPRPYWAHLEELLSGRRADWRAVLVAAGWAADEMVPTMVEKRTLEPLIQRVIDGERGLGLDLDVAVNEYGVAALDAGVLIGAALARTWPTSPDGLGEWPARAVAHAGIAPAEETTAT